MLTSPVIRCLKKQLPGIELHVLTKKVNSQLFENNPLIDKVFSLEHSLGAIIRELKNENYDFVVDLHKNIRSLQVKWALRVPSGSFTKLNFKKYMAVRFKINMLPDIHIVDRYFEAVKPLGVINDKLGLDYFIPETVNLNDENMSFDFRCKYIAVVIGGNHFTKILPSEKVIEVGRLLKLPLLLLGGKEDAVRGEQIALKLGNNVYNACGKLSLAQSASAVENAHIVLTNDTGLMHIAAAFKKKIVSVWGNTIPAFGMYPYVPGNEHNSIIIENKTLGCRPCSKIGFQKCPKKHFKCMLDLDAQKIAAAIEKLAN